MEIAIEDVPRRLGACAVGDRVEARVVEEWGGPRHTIAATELVGPRGMVFAVHAHPLAVQQVKSKAQRQGLVQIAARQSDCSTGMDESSADAILAGVTSSGLFALKGRSRWTYSFVKMRDLLQPSLPEVSVCRKTGAVQPKPLFMALLLGGETLAEDPLEVLGSDAYTGHLRQLCTSPVQSATLPSCSALIVLRTPLAWTGCL